MKEAEAAIGEPLVETRVGGVVEQRSDLTSLATQLVEDFAEFRQRMHQVAREEFIGRFSPLRAVEARVLESDFIDNRKPTRSDGREVRTGTVDVGRRAPQLTRSSSLFVRDSRSARGSRSG